MFELFKSRDSKDNTTPEQRRTIGIINIRIARLELNLKHAEQGHIVDTSFLEDEDQEIAILFSQLADSARKPLEENYQSLRTQLLQIAPSNK